MSPDVQQAAVLESIVPQLVAEGFEVFAHPSANLLPPFMQSYSPDAIAVRPDRKLAIEVLRKGASSQKKLDQLRELLSDHRDWELRVYWISPSTIPQPVEPVLAKDVEGTIKTIEELISSGLLAPALLMEWATLEALGRALLPEKFARPQTPGRLVEVLAADGYVTPSEADRLRQLAVARNQLIHGGLRVKIVSRDIMGFAAILKTLLQILKTA
jgi:REase_AHJR-like